jgi:hypothetical protein
MGTEQAVLGISNHIDPISQSPLYSAKSEMFSSLLHEPTIIRSADEKTLSWSEVFIQRVSIQFIGRYTACEIESLNISQEDGGCGWYTRLPK